MKYILTTKTDNIIMHISDTATVTNDTIDCGDLIFANSMSLNIHTVEEISRGVIPGKYCYTELGGFYLNSNYASPNPIELRIERLEQQKADLYIALANIIGGVE